MSPSSPQLAGLAVPPDGLPVAILCCDRQPGRVVTITGKMRCLLRNVHTEARQLDLAAVVESALLDLQPRLEAGGVKVLLAFPPLPTP
jgi:hypothetical protein